MDKITKSYKFFNSMNSGSKNLEGAIMEDHNLISNHQPPISKSSHRKFRLNFTQVFVIPVSAVVWGVNFVDLRF